VLRSIRNIASEGKVARALKELVDLRFEIAPTGFEPVAHLEDVGEERKQNIERVLIFLNCALRAGAPAEKTLPLDQIRTSGKLRGHRRH
jgi:hypothetical protein